MCDSELNPGAGQRKSVAIKYNAMTIDEIWLWTVD